MEEGGNSKLKAFLLTYNLDKLQDIKIKYQTKALDYYRRMLEARAVQQEFNDIEPSYTEGRHLLDGGYLDKDGDVI